MWILSEMLTLYTRMMFTIEYSSGYLGTVRQIFARDILFFVLTSFKLSFTDA